MTSASSRADANRGPTRPGGSDVVAPIKPLRRDAAENRQRILDAAEQVFADQGLDAPVEQIAQVAGVGMGTLYRRFPTKDALITELVRELLNDVLASSRDALDVPDGAGLEVFLRAAAQSQIAHRGCLPRLWSSPDTDNLKQQCRAAMASLLQDAQAHHRVRAEVELSDIDLVLWSLRGVIETTHGLTTTAWQRHLAIMIAGLRPTPEALTAPPLSAADVHAIRHRPDP